MRAAQVAVPETEAVELLAVAAVELGEIAVEVARLEQARLHLGDRRPEGVAEPREARRRTEIGERGTRNDTAQDQRPLGVAGDRAAAVAAGDPLEDIVEVPIDPPSSAPARPSRSPSTRSTSDPVGTISTGSRGRSAR